MAGTGMVIPKELIRFGDCVLNASAFELRRGRRTVKLERIPLQVLLILIEEHDKVVTREAIANQIWGRDVFLDVDNGINTAIRKIRQVLNDDPQKPRFVETIPGRGYRFIAPLAGAKQSSDGAAETGGVRGVKLPPNNLLLRHFSLVGRDSEIEAICNKLRNDFVRLLTLTGVGGAGKTTLGIAAGRCLLANFSDGVFFVDLAGVKQTDLVPSAVAQPFGMKEGGGKPIAHVLKDQLHNKQMLLILDNFEQLLSASSFLAELLAAAPGIKALVTSRSRLQLTFEHEFVVPPLAAPTLITNYSPAALMCYDAVKLFVDRARATLNSFALTSENAQPVAEICARLDGLPLAIELAAARIKVLSPHEILSRLDRRLKLLTGGPRDLPERQQTMRRAMDWSFDLLDNNEKCLFQRLAVFAGGFTFESAEEVAGGRVLASPKKEEPNLSAENEVFDVLNTLTRLVDQSLLIAEGQQHGDTRFRMLGIVREYALERLEASGELETMRQKQAAHFLVLAEAAEPKLHSAQPGFWLSRLEDEHDNIREALRWLIDNDLETAARMAAAIRYFWDYTGYFTEGLGILKRILSRIDQVPTKFRCKLFSMAGNMAKFQGDHETARQMYKTGLSEAISLCNQSHVSLLCRGLGGLAVEQGDHATARVFIDEALTAAQESNDLFGIARSVNMLGDLARSEGDNSTARELLKGALDICRQSGGKYATVIILNNLASAEFGDGDYEAARAHFTEGLTMMLESDGKTKGDRIALSYLLDGFAALAVQSGDAMVAAKLASASERLRYTMNFKIESAERQFREAYFAMIYEKLSDDQFAAAYEQGGRLDLDQSIALALGMGPFTPS